MNVVKDFIIQSTFSDIYIYVACSMTMVTVDSHLSFQSSLDLFANEVDLYNRFRVMSDVPQLPKVK
jgi:hypothetical protein